MQDMVCKLLIKFDYETIRPRALAVMQRSNSVCDFCRGHYRVQGLTGGAV